MHSTDCFCEQGNGGLAAKAYGSVNSIASTIAVPLLYRSRASQGCYAQHRRPWLSSRRSIKD